MKNDIQIFNYNDSKIRVIEQNGESWFVGKDVAEALGYKDTINALKDHVDKENKRVGRILDCLKTLRPVMLIAAVFCLL